MQDADSPTASTPGSVTLQMKQAHADANQRTPPTPDVRLYHRAVVVAQEATGGHLPSAAPLTQPAAMAASMLIMLVTGTVS